MTLTKPNEPRCPHPDCPLCRLHAYAEERSVNEALRRARIDLSNSITGNRQWLADLVDELGNINTEDDAPPTESDVTEAIRSMRSELEELRHRIKGLEK